MQAERRKQLLLVALVALLVVAVSLVYNGQPATSAPPRPASNRTDKGRTPASSASAETPDVHLEALSADRAKPAPTERNLFRFRPKAPPPEPVVTPGPGAGPGPVTPSGPVTPPGPPPPPPVPPIPYKFIGLVEVPGQKKRIAVLSDGRNVPLHGREGDIIEGRYRIVRIGAESIEMEHVDGRGRQTIRLSGS